ncbi:MAG: alpha/beta hydrolase [Alphaproteobacteria bacterium]
MKKEDGFNFLEFPSKSGKTGSLIIFLHGHSNHPEMFTDIAKGLQKEWPDADVLLVCGPEPVHASQERKNNLHVPDVDDLYTWYKSGGKPSDGLELALSHMFNRVPVVDELNKFVDAQLKKRGLKDENLVLYGFSLGGAIVAQMGMRRPDKCAAVVLHSSPVFPIVKAASKPDTLLLMGDEDHFFYTTDKGVKKQGKLKRAFDKAMSTISVHYDASLKRLKRAGFPTTGKLVGGLHHTISPESFQHTVDFLKKHLKGP